MTDTPTVMHQSINLIPDNMRESVVEILQARLYDAVDLTTHSKQACWNVKGPNFIVLNALFEQVHSYLIKYADLIAKRLVVLGGQAYGTARSSAQNSNLEEYPLNASHQVDHIEELSLRLTVFGAEVRADINNATDIGDKVTAQLFAEISGSLDKALWLVETHR